VSCTSCENRRTCQKDEIRTLAASIPRITRQPQSRVSDFRPQVLTMRIRALLLAILISITPAVATRSSSSHSYSTRSHSSSHSYHSHSSVSHRTHSSTRRSHRTGSAYSSHRSYNTRSPRASTYGVQRDSHGRIKRSAAAKNDFKQQHPCPSTGRSSGACPGYVVDHVRALECGGPDNSSNMQWQTIAAGKAKDKTERNCR
jgi:hypothetical protein